MSFLIRVASIREGAERLMEAQVIARLAQSAFISARPEVDAESMGKLTCIHYYTESTPN